MNNLVRFCFQISFDGITGRVEFTESGERTGFQLEIIRLVESGLSKVRNDVRSFEFNRLIINLDRRLVERIGRKFYFYTVYTKCTFQFNSHRYNDYRELKKCLFVFSLRFSKFIQEAPYVTFKNGQNITEMLNQNYTNNDFEGFCVDLLEELSRALKFRYKIKPITTTRYDDMVEEVKNKVKKKSYCLIKGTFL